MARKKQPLNTTSHTCATCQTDDSVLPMDTKIIAGFGTAVITKNRVVIYDGSQKDSWEYAETLLYFERMALKEPTADWRFELNLPLRDAVYQRQSKNQWVLIEKGNGFA